MCSIISNFIVVKFLLKPIVKINRWLWPAMDLCIVYSALAVKLTTLIYTFRKRLYVPTYIIYS